MTSVRSVNCYVEDTCMTVWEKGLFMWTIAVWYHEDLQTNGISKIKKGIYSWKYEILTESNQINILYLQYIAKNHAHAMWSTDATFVYGRYILTLIRA